MRRDEGGSWLPLRRHEIPKWAQPYFYFQAYRRNLLLGGDVHREQQLLVQESLVSISSVVDFLNVEGISLAVVDDEEAVVADANLAVPNPD